MYTGTSQLETSLRRAIVPAGADGPTRARIARLLLDLAGEIEQTGGMPPHLNHEEAAVMTVARVLDRWRPQQMLSNSPAYVRQVESLVRDVVLFVARREDHQLLDKAQAVAAMEELTLAGVDGDGVVAFIAHIREHGRPLRDKSHTTARPAADKTCNDYISALRQFFAWAVGVEGSGVRVNPCEQVQWVGGRRRGGGRRGRSRQMRAATAAEARAIIAAAPLDWSEWYRADAEMGMRAGAFERLLPVHMDIADVSRAFVRPTPDLSRKHVAEAIEISPELAEIIAARIRRKGIAPDQPVFGRRPHRETFHRHVEAAGVAVVDDRGRTLGLHGFRRFMGTEMARRGVPVKVIQERMGHANIETTMLYLDHGPGEHSAAAQALGNVLDFGVGLAGDGEPAGQGRGGPVAPATGQGGLNAQGRGGSRVARSEPYQLAGSDGQWALQGSNHGGRGSGVGGEGGGALQETVYRLVGMTMSALAPEQAARVLRAIAAAIEAEVAAAGGAARAPAAADAAVSALPLAPGSPPADAPSAHLLTQAG